MRLLRIALSLCALSLLADVSWAQAKDWLALPLGPSQDLVTEKSGARTARIPVRYADAAASAPPKQLQVRIFDVATKDGHGTRMATELAAEFQPADALRDMAILVTIPNTSTEILPGAVALSMRVSPDFGDPKETVQTVAVTLTAPTPQVQADAIVIGQVRAFPGLGADTSNPGSLRLVEKGGKAAVRGISLSTFRDSPPPSQPDSATLSFGGAVPTIEPNAVANVAVAASGIYPLGKTPGKIELRSRDLSAPVVVAYEVRARRDVLWIVVVVALGAIAGYVVRTALASAQALSAAKVIASKAAEMVDKEFAENDDAPYRKALADLRALLARAFATGDAKAITEEAKRAQDAIVVERGRLEQRLQPLIQLGVTLHALLDRPWAVPPAAAAEFAALVEAGSKVEVALARRNADGVKEIWAKSVQPALRKTANALRDAGGRFGQYVSRLSAGSPPLVDADQLLLRQTADALVKKFPWPTTDAADATVDDVSALLSTLTTELSVSRKLMEQMPELCDTFVAEAGSRLLRDEAATDAAFAAIKAHTREAFDGTRLRAEAQSQEVQFDKLDERMRAIRAEWQQYLISKAPKVNATDLESAVKRGTWLAAVDLAVVAMTVKPMPLGNAAADATARAAAKSTTPTSPAGTQRPTPDAPPQPSGSPLSFSPVAVLRGTLAEQLDLLKQGAWASKIQSAVLALLFIAGVFVLYEENWVGTGKEMLALFMLAFGIDLTTDSVLAAFKKLKLPEI